MCVKNNTKIKNIERYKIFTRRSAKLSLVKKKFMAQLMDSITLLCCCKYRAN
jgi:hypothetical protein